MRITSGNALRNGEVWLGAHNVTVESNDFNERWAVKCVDERVAHALFTPPMIERFLRPDIQGHSFIIEGAAIVHYRNWRHRRQRHRRDSRDARLRREADPELSARPGLRRRAGRSWAKRSSRSGSPLSTRTDVSSPVSTGRIRASVAKTSPPGPYRERGPAPARRRESAAPCPQSHPRRTVAGRAAAASGRKAVRSAIVMASGVRICSSRGSLERLEPPRAQAKYQGFQLTPVRGEFVDDDARPRNAANNARRLQLLESAWPRCCWGCAAGPPASSP